MHLAIIATVSLASAAPVEELKAAKPERNISVWRVITGATATTIGYALPAATLAMRRDGARTLPWSLIPIFGPLVSTSVISTTTDTAALWVLGASSALAQLLGLAVMIVGFVGDEDDRGDVRVTASVGPGTVGITLTLP